MNDSHFRGLLALVAHLLSRINPLLPADEQWRRGGWLCVIDTRKDPYGRVVLHQQIGEVPTEKVDRYKLLSLEKAQRLIRYPDHRTSYETRNPACMQYGGAIRVNGCIISFSGLPEVWDEILVLFAAWEHHLTGASILQQVRPEVRDGYTHLRQVNG